jgi:hypothetical protein
MSDQGVRYAIAVPEIPQFIAQLERVQPWVRSALGLTWLIVAPDGTVRIEAPEHR